MARVRRNASDCCPVATAVEVFVTGNHPAHRANGSVTCSPASMAPAITRAMNLVVISHIKKRLQAMTSPKLPLDALCQVLQRNKLSVFSYNLELLFIEIGFKAASTEEKTRALTATVKQISTFSAANQETFFRLLVRALPFSASAIVPNRKKVSEGVVEHQEQHDTVSSFADDEVEEVYERDANVDAVLDFVLDFVLYEFPSSTTVDVTNYGLMTPRMERLQRTKVTELTREALYEHQLHALRLVKEMDIPVKLKLPVYLAGSASFHHAVKAFSEEQLSRVIKYEEEELEDTEVMRRLMVLVLGSQVAQSSGGFEGADATLLANRARLAACTESCSWNCEHVGSCPLPCGAPCTRRLCDRRCTKSLECGHQCPSICGEDCPSEEFCHECGDDDVKERVADVILFQTYREIDPSEDPVVILPCCSIVYTLATLDGTLQMSKYYDSNGKPLGPLPEGFIDTSQCPNCKKPVRGLRRYGRVTKRAAIDSAEKNFISHSHRQLKRLQERTNAVVESGDLSGDKNLRHDLRKFGATVKRPPCQKAFEACVALLTKAKGGRGGDVYIDPSTLPVPNSKFQFLGYFYLLSAQLSLLSTGILGTYAAHYARQAIDEFGKGAFSNQTSEARLVLAQVLLRNAQEKIGEEVKTEKEREMREKAVEKVAVEVLNILRSLKTSGESFLSKYGRDLEILRERTMVTVQRARNATFYQSVSKDEMKAIKLAMQAEFQGSGHWYRCANGHSYSIGECGMAMERSRCPECGAVVGGQNHTSAAGNVHDMQMDSL